MNFDRNTRYLKGPDGFIHVWQPQLAVLPGFREFFPDFGANDKDPGEAPAEGLVTKDFLMTRKKDQLCAYAKDVYGVALDPRETKDALVNLIMDIQQKTDQDVPEEGEIYDESGEGEEYDDDYLDGSV